MTRDDQFMGQVEDYLDAIEGTTPLPPMVRDAIRAELPDTKQVSPQSGLRRIVLMTQIPRPARYGLVAAIALVAIFLGANFLGRSPDNTGGPVASAAPTSNSNAKPLSDFQSHPDLPAGTYYLADPYPARVEVTVPEGWWHWYDRTTTTSGINSFLVDSHFGDGSSAWGIGFLLIKNVRVDPCSPAQYQDASAMESAESLANAFAAWPGYSTTITDTLIAGQRAKKVVLYPPSAARGCSNPALFLTTSDYSFDGSYATDGSYQGSATVNQFYLVDVDGGVLVIWTTDYQERNDFEIEAGMSPDPTAHVADQQTLHAILDSLRILPL